MGSGIALLAAELMAGLEIDGQRTGGLVLIDSRPQSIAPLRAYLERHILRRALRRLGNEGEARKFSDRAMALVSTAAGLEAARDCALLFEAVPESEELKTGLLRRLRETCPPEALFLSNTSSIPIRRLDGGRRARRPHRRLSLLQPARGPEAPRADPGGGHPPRARPPCR